MNSPARGSASPWVLKIGLLTDVGRSRDRNEDAHAAYVPYDDDAPPARGDALFLVADGMGGHEAGDIASAFVAESVRDWFTLPGDVPGGAEREPAEFVVQLRGLLERTNDELVQLARREGFSSGSGSTATVACFRDGALHVAHVGDTRLYRLRDGALEQLTEDHSWVAEQARAGLLNETEAANHPQRHMLTECLGVGSSVTVFTAVDEVLAGDRYLLCSDGLHGPLNDDLLASVLAAEADPQGAARRLVALANERSGPDNITAVVVHVEGADVTRERDAGPYSPAMAVTVPNLEIAARPEPVRVATLPRLLLALGTVVLVAAAVVGERSLRAAAVPDAAGPAAPTTSEVLSSPSSVPDEESDETTGGRTQGEAER